MNNRYQSANVTLGLSCQRDADTHVTDTATQVRGAWRHAVAMSNVYTEPLSECEQTLSIRERDAGIVTARDADMSFTDTTARVRWGLATHRHEVMRRTRRRYRIANNRYQSANVALGA